MGSEFPSSGLSRLGKSTAEKKVRCIDSQLLLRLTLVGVWVVMGKTYRGIPPENPKWRFRFARRDGHPTCGICSLCAFSET